MSTKIDYFALAVEDLKLYAEFLPNKDGWGYLSHDNWALWKSPTGRWFLDSEKGIHQEIKIEDVQVLLAEHDIA
jgi:hypothetical protein